MVGEKEKRKEDTEADNFNYFLVLGQPGDMIKGESVYLPPIFLGPCPQCWASVDE